MGVAAIKFAPGWLDRIEPGRPFRMHKGVQVKDQISRKRLRDEGELHSPDEVARMLKVKDAETVRDWIQSGKLEAYKVGRYYRISDSQIEKFLGAKK